MHIKNLINSNPDWLKVLTDDLKIKATRNEDGRLVSLKYTIDTDMNNPLAQECRGMVVDTSTNRIIAHPYNKFWNSSEGLAAKIDWHTARVQAKEDGSLHILYYDPVINEWSVASSGHPTAGGQINETNKLFRELFWDTFLANNMKLPEGDVSRESCYMFELCTMDNRIVVVHDKPRLVCHGARIVTDDCELEWTRPTLEYFCRCQNWEIVREYPLNTLEQCISAAQELNPVSTHGEGFVVVDAYFNRVKIKNPAYVALHNLSGAFTKRRVIELWQTASPELDEIIQYFPDFKIIIDNVVGELNNIVRQSHIDFYRYVNLPSRKDFASAVKDFPHSSILFKLYQNAPESRTEKDVEAIIKNMNMSAIERLLTAS